MLKPSSSSRPLATFHTSTAHTTPHYSPSFTSDLSSHHAETPDLWNTLDSWPSPVLIDPVSGDARGSGSTSGKEAARVVKFSPEGSSRDLMVFSEVRVITLSLA